MTEKTTTTKPMHCNVCLFIPSLYLSPDEYGNRTAEYSSYHFVGKANEMLHREIVTRESGTRHPVGKEGPAPSGVMTTIHLFGVDS